MDRSELEIAYPCRWQYTLFGRDEPSVRTAVAVALGGRDHDLAFSHRSSKGTYVSMQLEVEVSDEAERDRIWNLLHDLDEIVRVL